MDEEKSGLEGDSTKKRVLNMYSETNDDVLELTVIHRIFEQIMKEVRILGNVERGKKVDYTARLPNSSSIIFRIPWIFHNYLRFTAPSDRTVDMILSLIVGDRKTVDERVGDLVVAREIEAEEHGETYARIWFWWWAFWTVIGALGDRLPGKFLLNALKKKIGMD